MRVHASFDPSLHTVLVAHLFLQGAKLSSGYEVRPEDEKDHVVTPAEDLGSSWAYVALGDVHKPQALGGRAHVRYSGSIERLNCDERDDEKGVVLFEIGPHGLDGEPRLAPPRHDAFSRRDHRQALRGACRPRGRLSRRRAGPGPLPGDVHPGVDDLDEIHRRIDAVFPRCYQRVVVDATRAAADPRGRGRGRDGPRGFREDGDRLPQGPLDAEDDANAEAVLPSPRS